MEESFLLLLEMLMIAYVEHLFLFSVIRVYWMSFLLVAFVLAYESGFMLVDTLVDKPIRKGYLMRVEVDYILKV
jgi:hypothetical protein